MGRSGGNYAHLSSSSGDAGKALDAHTGLPLAVVTASQLLTTVTEVTGDHTLALADAPNGSGSVEVNSASAANVTVPPNSSVAFPVGTVVEVWRRGAGSVTLVAGAGVTIEPSTNLAIATQHTGLSLLKTGTDTWTLGAASGLQSGNNLSDVADADTSRANLRVPVLRHCQAAAISNVASLSALQTIDGYTLVDGDRVLLTAQTTGSQNGPWVAHSGAWTRPNEYAAGATLLSRIVSVVGGTTNAKTLWQLSSQTSITVGTTATTWEKVGGTTTGGSSFNAGLFGDGSDGAATLDGTATVSWATLSGSTYTMTADCQLTALTINAGVTLVTTGYRIKCQGTVTNNGTISANGKNAVSATGAAGLTAQTIGGSQAGANGTTTAGANGSGGTTGGFGGAGGAGASGGGGSGGGIPAVNTVALGKQIFAQPAPATSGVFLFTTAVRQLTGASGGGGGGGDSTNAGGGGGSGGAPIVIFTHAFVNNGTVSTTGGNGFTPATGNCGGGGGGGGGVVIIYTLSAATMGTVTVAAGSGGSGVGTGVAGAAGAAGWSLNVVLT